MVAGERQVDASFNDSIYDLIGILVLLRALMQTADPA
jgi:hypothetical protein